MSDRPLTVTFTINQSDVYIDPDGVSWYVDAIGPFDVTMKRIVTKDVNARDLVRKWRKLGEDDTTVSDFN